MFTAYSRTAGTTHCLRTRELFSSNQIFEKDDPRTVPDTRGDGAARFACDNHTESLRRAGQVREKFALGVRRKWFCRGQMPQDIENHFVGFDERSFKARGAELQDGIAFVEVPGQRGAHGYGAVETDLRFLGIEAGRHVRVEDQNDAAIILTGELADHQRAQSRGSFPVYVARTVSRLVVAQCV